MARNRDSGRDRAGHGPDPDRGVRLVSIDRLRDFRIADDDPDIRGWEVRTLSGRQLGDVKDLLVDPEAGEVVMMEIELAGDDRRTLAPIRAAQIDRERRCVVIDSAEVDRGFHRADVARGVREEHPRTEAERRRDDEAARRAERAESTDRDDGGADADEVVVERRPVVYEEVVVRRKDVTGEVVHEERVDDAQRSRRRDEPA